MIIKEYKYIEKRETFKKVTHTVLYPKNHSTIQALVFNVVDLNWGDDWANITNWHTLCMVLRKGETEWKTLFDGKSREFKINNDYIGHSVFEVLFQLEKEHIRTRLLKNAEIRTLKKRIKEDTKYLKELTKK